MVVSTNSAEGYSEYLRSDATGDSEQDSVTVTASVIAIGIIAVDC
nr:unnamed protein product [Callosobruchus analis]